MNKATTTSQLLREVNLIISKRTRGERVVMVRSRQYQEFWLTLHHLATGGMYIHDALNAIARKLRYSKDKFSQGIIQIAKEQRRPKIAKKRRAQPKTITLKESMEKSGLFSEIEIEMIICGNLWNNISDATILIVEGNLLTRSAQYALFYQTLGSLLALGAPILWAIKISAKGLDEPLQKAAAKIEKSLRKGDDFATPMRLSGLFSPYECDLVAAKEEIGELDSALFELAELSRPI